MLSFVKIFSSRKRASDAWKLFSYDEQKRKSCCLIQTSNGVICNTPVATKNLTKQNNQFWFNNCPKPYSQLSVLVVNLLAAPASQAFVERLLLVCGMLTCGR
jgi:hypothetical protein